LKAIIPLLFFAIIADQLDDLLPAALAAVVVVVLRTSNVH
jgi:hypothetical protein